MLAVNDDWRLRVTLLQNDDADTLAGGLAAGELEHDLTASLKEHAALIQKVSAQLEAARPAPQVAANSY